MTIERRSNMSSWTFSSHEGTKVQDFPVTVKWEGPLVTVRIRTPEGEAVERRGQMEVQRTPDERIQRVRVLSLLGDVVGADRTMRGAAEDYASKVMRVVVDQRRREKSSAAKSQSWTKIANEGQEYVVDVYVPFAVTVNAAKGDTEMAAAMAIEDFERSGLRERMDALVNEDFGNAFVISDSDYLTEIGEA